MMGYVSKKQRQRPDESRSKECWAELRWAALPTLAAMLFAVESTNPNWNQIGDACCRLCDGLLLVERADDRPG
jgi:hypothetical protein